MLLEQLKLFKQENYLMKTSYCPMNNILLYDFC